MIIVVKSIDREVKRLFDKYEKRVPENVIKENIEKLLRKMFNKSVSKATVGEVAAAVVDLDDLLSDVAANLTVEEIALKGGIFSTEAEAGHVILHRAKGEKTPTIILSIDPAGLTVPPGQTGTAAVGVQSVYGFSGNVSLSCTGSLGVNAALAHQVLKLNKGQAKKTTLTIQSDQNASGTHQIPVTAAVGRLKAESATKIVTVYVSDPGVRGKGVIDGYVREGEIYKKEGEEEDEEKKRRKGIPGVKVYIEGMESRFSTTTNADGYYEITGIDFLGEADIVVAAEKTGYAPKPARKEITIKRNERKRCDFELAVSYEDVEGGIIYDHSIGLLTTDEAWKKLTDLGYSGSEADYMIKTGTHTFGAFGKKLTVPHSRFYKRGAPGGAAHYARSPLFGKIREGKAPTIERMDPKLRSVMNSSRRELQKGARGIYKKFMGPKQAVVKKKQKRVKQLRKRYQKMLKQLDRVAKGRISARQTVTRPPGGVGGLKKLFGGGGGGQRSPDEQKQVDARRIQLERVMDYTKEELKKAEDEYRALRNEMPTREAVEILAAMFKAESKKIVAKWLLKKPAILRGGDPRNEGLLRDYLNGESDRLAFYYGRQYNHWLLATIGWLGMTARNLGAGMATWGDVWGLLLDNIRAIIFGPWIWGILLIFLQYHMINAWVRPIAGANWLFIIPPILLGLLTFMMNLASSEQPMDWLTHIIAGSLAGFTAIVFLIAIWTPQDIATFSWSFEANSWFTFFALWTFLALFIGVFQFYHSGGFAVIFQMAILIMIFAYLALGPYSGYYNYVLDEVKLPLSMAFRTVSNAFNDIWTLATDPTKWYEERQLINIVPETPLEQPRALEVTSIAAKPSSAPACTEFDIDVVIMNKGDTDVRDVRATAECSNKWCKYNSVDIDIEDKIRPGGGEAFTLTPFIAMGEPGRSAEFHMATADVKVSYSHETNSSLKLTVMNPDEIDKLVEDGKVVYSQVTAVGKGTPARLSINVGNQPLEAGENARILVSVSGSRDDGTIILKRGVDVIRVHINDEIGKILHETCRGEVDCVPLDNDAYPNDNGINCTVDPSGDKDEVEIEANNFGSILHFICDMEVYNVEKARTGLITAELPNYRFEIKRDVDVSVTKPIGLIFAGDECAIEEVVIPTPSGPGGEEPVEPTISDVSSRVSGDRATITWVTEPASESTLHYKEYGGSPNAIEDRSAWMHVKSFDIEQGKIYVYKVSVPTGLESDERGFTTKACGTLDSDECRAATDTCKLEGGSCVSLSEADEDDDGTVAPITININGYVRDADGDGLKGLRIRLYHGGEWKDTEVTASDGYYEFTSVVATTMSKWTITVSYIDVFGGRKYLDLKSEEITIDTNMITRDFVINYKDDTCTTSSVCGLGGGGCGPGSCDTTIYIEDPPGEKVYLTCKDLSPFNVCCFRTYSDYDCVEALKDTTLNIS